MNVHDARGPTECSKKLIDEIQLLNSVSENTGKTRGHEAVILLGPRRGCGRHP